MSDRKLLICPGATKAGTSWLYRWLHDHPECHVRAIKELHYFSSFDHVEADKKIEVFERQLATFRAERADAFENNIGWKVRNMDRRIDALSEMVTVLNSDRTNDVNYATYLANGAKQEQVLVDVTPAYSVLTRPWFERMAKLPFDVHVLYMLRDPLDRMWSHCRMHAKRYLREGEVLAKKSAGVLKRILRRGIETHIMDRSDYVATIRKMAPVFRDKLHLAYAEELSTQHGQKDICDFLGIAHKAPDHTDRTHAGAGVPFPEEFRVQTVEYLKDQYDFIANHFGPVPENWAKNRALVV